MSFVHVLGQIGKGILKVAPVAAGVIGGPVGLAITAASSVASAELTHGPGSGPTKAADAAAAIAASPTLAASPVPPETRAQHIRTLIDGIVAVLNAIALLFPEPPPSGAPK